MKKLFAVVLTVGIIVAAAFGLVACNKDKITTEALTREQAESIYSTVVRNADSAQGYRLSYTCEETSEGQTVSSSAKLSRGIARSMPAMLGTVTRDGVNRYMYLGYFIESVDEDGPIFSPVPAYWYKEYPQGGAVPEQAQNESVADSSELTNLMEEYKLFYAQNVTRYIINNCSVSGIRTDKNGNFDFITLSVTGTYSLKGVAHSVTMSMKVIKTADGEVGYTLESISLRDTAQAYSCNFNATFAFDDSIDVAQKHEDWNFGL